MKTKGANAFFRHPFKNSVETSHAHTPLSLQRTGQGSVTSQRRRERRMRGRERRGVEEGTSKIADGIERKNNFCSSRTDECGWEKRVQKENSWDFFDWRICIIFFKRIERRENWNFLFCYWVWCITTLWEKSLTECLEDTGGRARRLILRHVRASNSESLLGVFARSQRIGTDVEKDGLLRFTKQMIEL